MSDAERLLQQALELPTDDREHLAHALFVSLRDELHLDRERAWAAEILRRVQQVERGEVKTIPATEALARARAELAKMRD